MRSLKLATSPKHRAERTSTQPRNDGGAAAVELAIVMPVLLTLIFGIIYFGFIFAAQISLNSSARDAARAGAVQSLDGVAKTCPQIAQAARDGAQTIGLDPIKIDITVIGPAGTCTSPKNGAAGTGIAVKACLQPATAVDPQLKVILQYKAVSPVPLVPFSFNDLKATGAFQCEYS